MADDCIFCKIVAGELPVGDRPGGRAHDRVHGHQPVDARPRARDPAQALAQPLRGRRRGPRATPSAAAKRLALRMRDKLGCDGVNLLNCCEPAAWQTVFHTHIHVIPRYDDDPLQLPGAGRSQAEQDELAAGRRRAARVTSLRASAPLLVVWCPLGRPAPA